MKKPKSLCDTCKDRERCGSSSHELISPDDIEYLNERGIKAKTVIYSCNGYHGSITLTPSPTGEQTRDVFGKIDALRGYRPPKRKAEAASIIRMLKQYTPDQIISTWQKLKQDKFWKDKELFMMTVESQIGAILNGQKPKSGNGKYEHMVKRGD